MNYNLTPGSQSNIQIDVTCTQADLDKYKNKALQYFQKDIDVKGFRKGHVPLTMVEEQINPQYLLMAVYGEAIDEAIKKIVREQPQYRLIGEPYDLNQEAKNDDLIITCKIDLYPQVVEQSDAWKSLKPSAVQLDVTEDDIQGAINQLCLEHAEYKDTDIADETTIVRLKLMYLDETGAQLDQGVGFWGLEDAKTHSNLISKFNGVKMGDVIELAYSQTDLPKFFLSSKKDLTISTLRAEVTMISKKIVPEFTEENVKKRFSDVSSMEQLTQEIKNQLTRHKEQNAYIKAIDDYVTDAMNHITVILPKTILNAEVKSRKDNLIKRMGGENQYQKYIDQISPEQKEKMENDLFSSAKESLSKYFVMDVILKHYDLNAQNYQNDADAKLEKDLYYKIVS